MLLWSMTRTLLLALVVAFTSGSANAAPADKLTDCSAQSIEGAGINHASEADAIAICEDARKRLHFDLTEDDLQHLVDVSAAARLTAMKRDFDLPAVTAAGYVISLVDLRGLASDRDAFVRTADLTYKIDIGTEGVVSPGVLLAQLHAAGPFAKTMSDDGLISFAALASVEEKKKVAAASFAVQQPVSVEIVGPWRIIGHIGGGGRIISCSMFRDAKDGAGEFSYTILIAAMGELKSLANFAADTTLPNGSRPIVNAVFDKSKPTQLTTVVRDGRMILSLPDGAAALRDLLDHFQHSAILRITPAGKPKSAITVDLTGADDAFDQNGLCMKNAMARGMSEMKASSGD